MTPKNVLRFMKNTLDNFIAGGWKPLGAEAPDLINVEKDVMNSGIEELDHVRFMSNAEKTYQIIESEKDFILPLPGKQIRLVTFKAMNAAVLVEHISRKEKIKEMLISAYSVNYESAKLINDILDLNGATAEILISNLRNKAHRKKEELTKQLFLNNKKCKVFFCSSHAKIISLKTEKNNYYHIEGSGNLSFNSRVEQYCVDNSEDLFYFTQNWFAAVRELLKNKKELVSFNYEV